MFTPIGTFANALSDSADSLGHFLITDTGLQLVTDTGVSLITSFDSDKLTTDTGLTLITDTGEELISVEHL
tara:strand:- start:842 stop:1054 length:213 start_codon:yes stop_codon:yes gene_type:complete